MNFQIGSLAVGFDYPCRTVAELSNNHNGSLDRALCMVDAAMNAGADAIKLQCYSVDELVALRGDGPAPAQWGLQGWSMRRLYEKAATAPRIVAAVAAYCDAHDIPWFSSFFGRRSLAMLEALACPVYKIARLDNLRADLRDAALATGKRLLVSTSDPVTPLPHVVHLWCPPGYPSAIDDVRLPCFGRDYLGLSSHCLAPELPVAAVARGAKLIEMHFQLADEPSELEANLSMTEHDWRRMVEQIRLTERLLA